MIVSIKTAAPDDIKTDDKKILQSAIVINEREISGLRLQIAREPGTRAVCQSRIASLQAVNNAYRRLLKTTAPGQQDPAVRSF